MKRELIGSDFDDFLKQDGLLAGCEAGALNPDSIGTGRLSAR